MRPVKARVSPDVSGLRKRNVGGVEGVQGAEQSEKKQHTGSKENDCSAPRVAFEEHGGIIEGREREEERTEHENERPGTRIGSPAGCWSLREQCLRRRSTRAAGFRLHRGSHLALIGVEAFGESGVLLESLASAETGDPHAGSGKVELVRASVEVCGTARACWSRSSAPRHRPRSWDWSAKWAWRFQRSRPGRWRRRR